MNEIKCPHDLNQFLLGEPIFENTFPEEECEQRKFYGDCYHCFSTAIANRDHQLKEAMNKIREIVDEWKLNTWKDNISYECMVKIDEMFGPQESEKINCKTAKCENCTNHNYCDYEPQESEGVE